MLRRTAASRRSADRPLEGMRDFPPELAVTAPRGMRRIGERS